MKLPIYQYTYDQMMHELDVRVSNKLIDRKVKGDLHLYNYTQTCQNDSLWDDFTVSARGLVVDTLNRQIIGRTFEKFFNNNQPQCKLLDESFEVFEKLDGSCISCFYHNNEWKCVTRGSFDSDQAIAAKRWLDNHKNSLMDPTLIYVFEWVGPSNQIVVRYEDHQLVFLAAFDQYGNEQSFTYWSEIFNNWPGFRAAKRFENQTIESILGILPNLTKESEGFVVRYESGYRVKFKGDEYLRLHRLISKITPLAIWDMMMNGDDLDKVRLELPDEFLTDFDLIVYLFNHFLDDVRSTIHYVHAACNFKTRKDAAMVYQFIDPCYKVAFWAIYDNKPAEYVRKCILKSLRPTGNKLSGYEPSKKIVEIGGE